MAPPPRSKTPLVSLIDSDGDSDSSSKSDSDSDSGIAESNKQGRATGGEADTALHRLWKFMARYLPGSDRPESVPIQKFEDLCKKYLEKKEVLGDQRNLISGLRAKKTMLQDRVKVLERKGQKDESQIADLRREVEHLAFKGESDEVEIAGLHQHVEALGRQCHETERARQAEEAEKKALERHVLMLKRDLSASTKVGNQITDDEIRQKVDKIFYSIHGFAASILRKGRLDISKLGENAKEFLKNHVVLTSPASLSRQCEIALVVCVCSDALIRLQHISHYFGLPPPKSNLKDAYEIARSENVHRDDLKAWLEPTRKVMSQADSNAVQQADQNLLDCALDTIKRGLGASAAVDWKAAEPALRKALVTGHGLFRSLHHSKASFRMEMHPVRTGDDWTVFNDNLMTAINSLEEEDVLVGRPLAVCAFPAIHKYGNELGENQDERTVVCRARVIPQD
ncbi:hypothetical protein D0859_09211 [Hortaea werneckii]|uniref:Uncharacterized protein n=1 Tax=Hortaea werneckii TaxID=91943 RepID=A0A3M7IMF8_HORWE|nr:hypothetical protein D0859_09211 [Hortaea werneckii]